MVFVRIKIRIFWVLVRAVLGFLSVNEFNKNCLEIPKIHLEQILVQTVKTSSGSLSEMLTKLIWETRIWQHALTELWLELWIQLIKILLVVLVMPGMLTGKRSKLYKGSPYSE